LSGELTGEETDVLCYQLAAKKNGKYMKKKVGYANSNKFKCQLDHTVTLTTEELFQKKWCSKCDTLWEDTKSHFKRHKIKCFDTSIKPTVKVRCVRGHVYDLSILKAKRSPCKDCKQTKEEFKNNLYLDKSNEKKTKQEKTGALST